MENQQSGEPVVSYHQFPHEETMRALGLQTERLEAPLKRQIEAFNRLYYEKSYDGILSGEEMAELNNTSLKIAEQLKEHYQPEQDGSGAVLGILGGIGLGILAFLGIRKIGR